MRGAAGIVGGRRQSASLLRRAMAWGVVILKIKMSVPKGESEAKVGSLQVVQLYFLCIAWE